jgi:SAM-dependent methyltransferase
MNAEDIAGAYGSWVGSIYDDLYATSDMSPLISFVQARIPEGGKVIDFGAGTGRVTIPLAESGLEVTGLELSEEMLRLHIQKDALQQVTLKRGDFTDPQGDAEYDVTLIVNNTLFMAPEQSAQRSVFEHAIQVTKPGGFFIVEAYAPERFIRQANPTFQYTVLGDGTRILLDTIYVAPELQQVTVARTLIGGGNVGSFVERSRYCWPSELDLLAELVGFDVLERFGGWDESAVTSDSTQIISVYRRPSST